MKFIIYRQMIGDRNYHIHGTVVTYTDPWSFLLIFLSENPGQYGFSLFYCIEKCS